MKDKFILCSGTVQPYVFREQPWFMRHFGCAVYDRDKPVLSEGRRARAQPIIDRMNAGELTPEQGMELLNEHAFW
jgi:hypothetical protein